MKKVLLWGAIGGVIAGAVMAMWQMGVEAVAGEGLFAPPVYIAAALFRDAQGITGSAGLGPTDVVQIMAGMMGHMMNSALFGLLFATIASRLTRSRGGLVGLGMLWGAMVYAVMALGVIPAIDPVMKQLNQPTFFAGHLMFGAVLGWLVSSAARARIPAK